MPTIENKRMCRRRRRDGRHEMQQSMFMFAETGDEERWGGFRQNTSLHSPF